MIRINQLKAGSEVVLRHRDLGVEALKKYLISVICRDFPVREADITDFEILRESVDARKKPKIWFIYSVRFALRQEEIFWRRVRDKKNRKNIDRNIQILKDDETGYRFPAPGNETLTEPVIIVGAGPAGLFCAYYLAVNGYRPILIERGDCVEKRQDDVEKFWETGVLDTQSNVQFGEGGAGTFSDGKLNTLVKDKDGRNKEVLKTFVTCGAKEEILFEAKPHIGTDALCSIVKKMRETILECGGCVHFRAQMTDFFVEEGCVAGIEVNGSQRWNCSALVLAVGHSARDTFELLEAKRVRMEPKAFAVGFRAEHPQEMINLTQYGLAHPGGLGAASYKTAAQTGQNRGVYSFCMCPGGFVVNASSEEGFLAVNGMSYSGRDGKNANSAIIVSVDPGDFGSEHPLAGMAFQRRLEKRAYDLGRGKIPMQRYAVFRECVLKESAQECLEKTLDIDTGMFLEDNSPCEIWPEHKGESVWADLSDLLPKDCNRAFVEGVEAFARQMPGFDRPDVILSGVESRTSSPVRIPRDETFQASVAGIYPCGEGAGYAGGITSAAMDGLRIAEVIAQKYSPATAQKTDRNGEQHV